MTTAQNLPRLTNSRMKTMRACQRLHHLMYVLCYRPVEDAAVLRFGTLIHLALEAWWRATPGQRLAAALAALQGEADLFEQARAEAMITGYHCRWDEDANTNYDVIDVEVEFCCELRNPVTGVASRTWSLAGKIDVIVRDRRDGRVFVVEHKSSAEDIRPGSSYWRRLRLDGQVSAYFEGAKSLGHDVAGCLYDVLGKPSLKPLKATPIESRKYTKTGALYANQRDKDETPEEYKARLLEDIANEPDGYFQRPEVVRLESEMQEALLDVWQLGKEIREAELAGRTPRNPDACVRYGRTCPFFGVCTGEESLEDPSKFVRSTTVHPELSGDGAPREETAP